jgi:fumarate reductase flavoprotein subunit
MSDSIHFPVVIVGGGGTGLSAALAAVDGGAEVLVIERDATPMGTTAMSTGLIPAAGTPEQVALGIDDSPGLLAQDIMTKTKGKTDAAMAVRMAEESAETFHWLRDIHGVPLAPIDGFLYPGHSVMRMVGTPNRTGGELMAGLEAAAERVGVVVLTEAVVLDLETDGDRVVGVVVERPDGARERIGCEMLILACSGFGGNAELVARHIPEMAEAVFHGHPGNRGDAVRWGEALGAASAGGSVLAPPPADRRDRDLERRDVSRRPVGQLRRTVHRAIVGRSRRGRVGPLRGVDDRRHVSP